MTEDELRDALRKRDEQQAARDVKKAARLGKLAALMDAGRFREESRRERLAERLQKKCD